MDRIRTNRRRMYYNDDSGTRLACYEGAFTPRMVTDAVDAVVGTAVTDVVFCVSYSYWGNYPSRVNPMPGWRDTPSAHSSPHYRRLYEFFRHVREHGWDIPKMVMDRAAKKGLGFLPSVRMNDAHFTQKVHPTEHPLTGQFWMEHQDLTLGPGQSGPWGDPQHYLDFAHEAVRQHLLDGAFEAIDRYAVDGFELDWTRHCPYFRNGCERPELLTEMIRRVRQRLDQKDGPSRLPLIVRVGPSIEENAKYGLDVRTWVAEGLVDVVVPSSPGRFISFGMPVDEWVCAAEGTGVEIHPSPDSAAPCGDGQASLEMYRAAAANCYAMGAHGFYIFNLFCRGYSYGDDAYMILRDVSDVDALSRRDKRFMADVNAWRQGDDGLPVGLGDPQRPATVALWIGDDLASEKERATLDRAMLRLRIDRLAPEDRFEIALNDHILDPRDRHVHAPDYTELIAWNASTASWTPERVNLRGPWAWIEIDLKDPLPNQGRNTVTVRSLVPMAEDRKFQPMLNDVELRVSYRPCGTATL